ncbi:hypothetical protein D3C86_1906670 [compost metagenome]
MQEAHGDRGIIELELGEDRRHFQGMIEIGVAGGALLRAMLLHGVHIGLVQQLFVGVRVIGLNAFDELILTHHGSRCSRINPYLAR